MNKEELAWEEFHSNTKAHVDLLTTDNSYKVYKQRYKDFPISRLSEADYELCGFQVDRCYAFDSKDEIEECVLQTIYFWSSDQNLEE